MNKQKSIESDQKKGTVLLIFTKFNYNDEDGVRDFHSLFESTFIVPQVFVTSEIIFIKVHRGIVERFCFVFVFCLCFCILIISIKSYSKVLCWSDIAIISVWQMISHFYEQELLCSNTLKDKLWSARETIRTEIWFEA